jgi:Protein of unknown function (DUF3237)
MQTDRTDDPLATPPLRLLADLRVDVGAVLEVGAVPTLGRRRLIPILGGTAQGPHWRGRILPGGADFQLIASERVALLEARYVIETDAGERIYVENRALRAGPPELIARLARGEAVDPALIYFRCAPRFEVSAPALQWMMERLFVGCGVRHPQQVLLRFFELG